MKIKINVIKRHIPNYCDHEPKDLVEVEFYDVDDLVQIEWVKRWTEHAQFVQFSVTREYADPYLMVEMKDGKYWVIGKLFEDVSDLPAWSKITCDERRDKIDNSGKEQ